MKHNQTIRSVRLAYLLLSAGVCLLGVVLIAAPEISARVLCRLGGGLLALFGVVNSGLLLPGFVPTGLSV